MPLRMTLADLTRFQRQWSAMISGSHFEPARGGDGRLQEVANFGANPGELRMLQYVPPTLPPGAALVVALHGCTQTAAGYDTGTGWSELAERHGFAVLMPEQVRSNNAHGCFNWFQPGDTARDLGEAASISQMIATMLAEHPIDPRQVYVTGLSAGGAMTSALLASYPELFAGGAIIAGLPFGAASNTQEAVAAMYHCRSLPGEDWGDLVRDASPRRDPRDRPVVSIWHGDADQTVTPSNAVESAKQWVDVLGLHAADGVEDQIDGVPHRVWRDKAGVVRVELYAVPGLAHGVPIDPTAVGDQGVGHAMPYVLDARVSSTWHIARSWGLVGPATEQQSRPAPSWLSDPRDVIARALRAAGLLNPA
jgi:poly(hydroxyalkanoate) depolymerase family esterase